MKTSVVPRAGKRTTTTWLTVSTIIAGNERNGTSLADSVSYNSLNCIAIFLLDSGQYVDVHEDAYLASYSVIKEMNPRTTGIYYVGSDVKAGEYKILPSNDEKSHYWAIYSDLSIRYIATEIISEK